MRTLFAFVLLALGSSSCFASDAADSACMTAAKEKKLSGAARTSFVTKCERDAKAKCEAAATEKKLTGAARTSNVNKCVRETGPAT